MARSGVIIAGLSSSSGKTLTSLGLLRAFKQQGHNISAAKTGPDYIDPGFHHAALNINHNDDHTSPQNASVNLDGFAMPPEMLRHLAEQQSGDLLIIEGVMGLYDGGAGSAVTLAQHLGLPIILVMDCRGQAETSAEIAAALKHRLAAEGVDLAGVILNRISTPRHGDGIKTHCHELGVPVLGALPNAADIDMPSRHLGLVQAFDLAAAGRLNHLLDQAASMMTEHLDLDAIMNAASPLTPSKSPHEALPPPPARRSRLHLMLLLVLPIRICWKGGGGRGLKSKPSHRLRMMRLGRMLILFSCPAVIQNCIWRHWPMPKYFNKGCNRPPKTKCRSMGNAAAIWCWGKALLISMVKPSPCWVCLTLSPVLPPQNVF